MSWSEMKQMTPSNVKEAFQSSKIVMCKRNAHGQFYVARGLREMIHFTLGPTGKTHLTAFLSKNDVNYVELRGEDNDSDHPPWFQVLSRSNKNSKERKFLDEVDLQLKSIAEVLIPELLKVRFIKLFTKVTGSGVIYFS